MRWDPQLYGRYADERGRPFADLLARVRVEHEPGLVVDLGCGPGALTVGLAERWPGARVIGVDSSPEMIAKARTVETSGDGRVSFVEADLRTWTAPAPVDVLVSNATLQWVPEHLGWLPGAVTTLAPGGVLALQVPHNFGAPSHVLLHELRNTVRWRPLIGDDAAPGLARAAFAGDPADYLAVLASAGCTVDAWESTYLHVLTGDDPVLEWMRGTGARPVLQALPDGERSAFEQEYAAALRRAYPTRAYGTVLPVRRVSAVAVRR